eukprot:TRINITY_DN17533_c0_g1_i1.p1 TRINITY_DN17533_c0_g1~~TRINITY_DN17533_c0_g1_i1.p1  ORF type:complete len:578 (-),score=39.22 TRINITY_DN17533_c0_g1_i1:246-1979(-)
MQCASMESMQRTSMERTHTLERSLSSTVAPKILRGVELTEVMSGFGKHWASISANPDDYELSTPTPELDAFISHDWCTPRWQKYLALSMIFNGPAACMWGVGASVVAGCLQVFMLLACGVDSEPALALSYSLDEEGQLSRFGWSARVATLCVWLMIFVWWQRIRSFFLRRERYVFLDKLCINQTDATLKADGVYGLAAFLRASDKFVVLWSPRYFARLWCAYELAVWSKLRGSEDVIIYPLGTTTIILAYSFLNLVISQLLNSTLSLPLVTMLAVAGIVGVVRSTQNTNRQLATLHSYLQSFSLQATDCYCCSADHTDPTTGEPLICDRLLVYAQLAKWSVTKLKSVKSERAIAFPHCVGDTKSALDCTEVDVEPTTREDQHLVDFDQLIRTSIRDSLLKSASLTYWQALCLAIPHFCLLADRLPYALFEDDPLSGMYLLFDVMVSSFLFNPLAMRIFSIVSSRLSRRNQYSWLVDVVFALGCAVCTILLYYLQGVALVHGSWPTGAGVVLLEFLGVMIVYRTPDRCAVKQEAAAAFSGESIVPELAETEGKVLGVVTSTSYGEEEETMSTSTTASI